jgi:hypothetical protein
MQRANHTSVTPWRKRLGNVSPRAIDVGLAVAVAVAKVRRI